MKTIFFSNFINCINGFTILSLYHLYNNTLNTFNDHNDFDILSLCPQKGKYRNPKTKTRWNVTLNVSFKHFIYLMYYFKYVEVI